MLKNISIIASPTALPAAPAAGGGQLDGHPKAQVRRRQQEQYPQQEA